MVFLPDTRSCSELYFLRHGIAAPSDDPQYKDDSLRPLTAQGKEKMRRAAKGMHSLGLIYDAIFSSPYLRAKQTAEMVAQVYKLKNNEIHYTNNLLPPASIEDLLKEVQAHSPRSKNVLLVGHEPHLTEMIARLLKLNPQGEYFDLKKGGLCCLSIQRSSGDPTAVLNWLLTSAQLGLMAP